MPWRECFLKSITYKNICTIMFLQPEVASVGINEKTCIEENIPVKVVKLDYSCIARAIAMRKTEGFFKIIVTDDKKMKILGIKTNKSQHQFTLFIGNHTGTKL